MLRAELALIALLPCAAGVCAAQALCEASEPWSPDGAISYLERSPERRSDVCTVAALEALSGPGVSPDPNLLVRYVTVARPVSGLHMITIGSVEQLYPAVAALVHLGEEGLPTLVAALKDEAIPEQVDRNVLRAMKLILARDSAALLRLLIGEARAAAGKERKRLDEAAALVALWCSDEESESCSELLSEAAAIQP